MSYQQTGGYVDKPTYDRATDLLFTPPNGINPNSGRERQTLQKIKHANETSQAGKNNPYYSKTKAMDAIEKKGKKG